MALIDTHVHFEIGDYPIIPSYEEQYGTEKARVVREKNAEMKRRWQQAWHFPTPLPPEADYRVTAQKWLEQMDLHHLERLVFTTCGTNELAEDILAIAPDKFVCYAHHDICLPDAAERLERAYREQGLRGYKQFAPLISRPLNDPGFEPVWEVAERYEYPVLIHFGILGGAGGIASHININPMALHDVAKAHPRIPFIVPHFGCGFPKDTLFLAWACPNIYVDTSGSNQWTRFMPYPLTVRDLFLKFQQTIGAARILFGTDSEWFPRGFVHQYLDMQMRDCVELGFSGADIDLIFSGNARTLLRL